MVGSNQSYTKGRLTRPDKQADSNSTSSMTRLRTSACNRRRVYSKERSCGRYSVTNCRCDVFAFED